MHKVSRELYTDLYFYKKKTCFLKMAFVQQCGSGSRRYRAKPFVRHHSGGDGTALSPQQQPAPHPFSGFGWEQRYNGGHSTALWPQQQPGPRPFLTLTGSRGTTAATVQRCGRSSSQAPAPSVALAGGRGTVATIDRR